MPHTDLLPRHKPSGLITKAAEAVALEGVSVEATLTDVSARVTITQRYRNTEPKAIEAVYVFPLDEGAAVCGFEAIVNGVHFAGETKSRDEAFRVYDDAMQAGHGAFLLDEEQPDVFTASVGNVLPGTEVLLKLTYVAELTLEGDSLRFVLPTTVSPRYAPAEDRRGVGRSPADAVSPPLAWTVPYGLDLTLHLAMPGAIRRVASPSHPIDVTLAGSSATVTLAQATTALDRDVVVLIDADGIHAPHVIVERDGLRGTAAALVLRPTFDTQTAPAEVWFVVDRSGSMAGSSIAAVRNALQLCLRSLAEGCRFNIVGFGSRFDPLFETSQPYNDATLAAASAHVASLDADLGDTEILAPLQFVFRQPRVDGLMRQVLVLTDGDVTNADAVIALAADHAQESRVFAFGIGRGASAHLVRGLARAGGGVAEFIAPGDRLEAKVVRQFARLLAPALTDVAITWGTSRATMAPSTPRPVFAGDRLVQYAFLDGVPLGSVSIAARGPAGAVSFEASHAATGAVDGTTVGTLAARARIRELEEQPDVLRRRGSQQVDRKTDHAKSEIIRLATTYGLASRETSLVAVEVRGNAVAGEVELRKIPVAVRSGWGGMAEVVVGSARVTAASRELMPIDRSLLLMTDVDGDEGDDTASDDTATPMVPSPGRAPVGRAPTGRRVGQVLSDLLKAPGAMFTRRPGAAAPRVAERRATRQASAPPPAARSAPSRGAAGDLPFDRLIALQGADGSWPSVEAVATALGVGLATVRQAQPAAPGPGSDDRAWATAIALAWLIERADSRQAEWRLLAAKAERWLAGAVVPGPWREIVERARAVV